MAMPLPACIEGLQSKLPSVFAPIKDESTTSLDAAVLVLLYPTSSTTHFALIRRHDNLRRHAGQYALPGGRVEARDCTYWDTALREAREELGVVPEAMRPLGRLPVVQARAAEFLIVPFVAWLPARPQFRPDPVEVSEAFSVPLTELLDPESLEDEIWEYRERRWNVCFYRLGGRSVWGITARILGSLVLALREPTLREAERLPGSVSPVDER